MPEVAWYRGVPWAGQALTAATADGVADVLTEIARDFRSEIQYDPGRVPPADVTWVERAGYTVGVNHDLVVVGHQRPDEASSADSGNQPGADGREDDASRPRGRGPKSYNELEEWLSDEGYTIVTPNGRNMHPIVVDGQMHRLVTLNHTSSDPKRALRNDTAVCRRVLGITLRRDK